MERKTTAQKIFFTLLDVLLVIGGIASVLTIERGQWVISILEYYGTAIEAMENGTYSQNTYLMAGGVTQERTAPGTGSESADNVCLTQVDLVYPDWHLSYLIANGYKEDAAEVPRASAALPTMPMCQ